MKLPLVDCYSCVLYYFLLKNTFQCTYSSYTILLLIMFYTLVFVLKLLVFHPLGGQNLRLRQVFYHTVFLRGQLGEARLGQLGEVR